MDPLTLQQQILVQLLIAFGQGAGTMPVARETIEAFRNEYGAQVPADETAWKNIEVATLAAAHRLGRLSAHVALTARWDTIRAAHFNDARTTMHASFICPFCLLAPLG